MFARQLAVSMILDDLSKHAISAREIYLLLRRPPGREAYPGEIFFVHSRLLERSAKLSSSLGGGSCSTLPVIETLFSDVSAYISTNVISITDGQLFLSQQLYLSSSLPAIDLTLSVTRVGSSAQWLGMKLLAGSYKLEISQYVELETFSQFLTDCSKETLARLARGTRILEILKQQAGSPMNLRQEIGILALANHGLLLNEIIPVSSVHHYLIFYLQIPLWTSLFVSIRTVGQAIIQAEA
jgi:F-type H+/Na+-transporting ATPase subunit alpha